jgi:hypothetical protein
MVPVFDSLFKRSWDINILEYVIIRLVFNPIALIHHDEAPY